MKPLGPIPAGYHALDGELAIGGHKASALVAQAGGTPLFVYSADLVRTRIASLRAAMPERLHIHYAIKANSYRPLLDLMAGLVDGFDIASGGELRMAQEAGLPAEKISFAGPGKRDEEIAAGVAAGVTFNVESPNEAERIFASAGMLGVRPRLAVRVNPDFELRGSGMKMGGGAKPFGVDAALVPDLARATPRPWR